MDNARLRLCRSLLFLPASNPRALAKARALAVDMVVLDLEDAVKPEDKSEARAAAAAAVEQGFGDRIAAIRMNAIGSAWYGQDVVALRASKADLVVLPKAESREQVHDTRRLVERPVLAMIESAAGVLAAPSIAAEAVGLIAGTNDLSADLGLPLSADRRGLAHALQAVVLAARAGGVAAYDGVYNGLDDDDGLVRQCEEGRAFGFDGKSLIHPSQVATANRIFSPGEAEIEAARRLIAAAAGGAQRHEGRMIEAMHVAQAEALIAKARR
ncbi:MAG TPA: CoA ester lyase [Allosphingosinicella sp.]|nr:CoA ester lyase [Allosphingosinicella sp.]